MSEPILHVGQLVAERYVVEGILGIGGLAEVYRVRHTGLGSIHALKVLTIRRKGFDDRLRLEGQIQAQLRHPNAVAVTDIVEIDHQPGLVMEYVDGTTLEALLRERGRLPHEEALALMTPVFAALLTAHGIGAVHRDLKPANILLARTPLGWVPKVVDFGIGKLLDSPTLEGNPRASDTRAGMAMGTPGYISPEQVRDSSAVDQRTDVFALGVILYEMIAGRLPYANPDGTTDITSTLVRDAPRLGELAPSVPPFFSEAVHRAIQKEPEDRYPSIGSFVAALGLSGNPTLVEPEWTGGRGSSPFTLSGPTTGGRSNATTPIQATAATPTQSGRGGKVLLVALPMAFGAVCIAGAAVALSFSLAMWGTPRTDVAGNEPVETREPLEAPAPGPSPLATQVLPAPVAPDPSPGTIEPGTAQPGPAPGPTPGTPAPGATRVPDAAPAPDPVPEPVPEPGPVQVVAVEPAPDPVPVVSVVALPQPAPEPPAPSVRIEPGGRWAGMANGRNVTLTLSGSGSSVQGTMLLPPSRTVKLNGSIDPGTGELHLKSDDGIRMDGRVTGNQLVGSYGQNGQKATAVTFTR